MLYERPQLAHEIEEWRVNNPESNAKAVCVGDDGICFIVVWP